MALSLLTSEGINGVLEPINLKVKLGGVLDACLGAALGILKRTDDYLIPEIVSGALLTQKLIDVNGSISSVLFNVFVAGIRKVKAARNSHNYRAPQDELASIKAT